MYQKIRNSYIQTLLTSTRLNLQQKYNTIVHNKTMFERGEFNHYIQILLINIIQITTLIRPFT